MPLPLLIPAAIAGVGALAKGITGAFQRRKANKIDASNPFVVEKANPIFQQNAAIADNMARTGLPQQQYNNSLNNIMRNQAGALTMFGRNPQRTNLASLLRGSNDATMNLDVQDANTRQNNQRFAFGQRLNLAQEQNRVWDWNNRQKFLMNKTRAEAVRGAGNQNLMGAFNDVSGIGLSMLGGGTGGATQGAQGLLGGNDTRQTLIQRLMGGGRVIPNQIPNI